MKKNRTSGTNDPSPSRRGENTYNALIRAGLILFGEYGSAGTSTRMLASRAKANISAIQYHFGSKEGLYRAVVEHIAERIGTRVGKPLRDIENELNKGDMPRERALEALQRLLTGMSDFFAESDEPRAWARIIVREQMSPSPVFSVIYERQIRPVQMNMNRLIAICTGLSPESDEAKLRGHIYLGQVLGFLVGRESVLRNLHTGAFSSGQTALIHYLITEHAACGMTIAPFTEENEP